MTTMSDPRLKIADADRERLKIMFLAKHAKSDGSVHAVDGTHAVYHHELAGVLRGLDLNLVIGNTYTDLIEVEDIDYVFTLLNRGGFLNSEMLGPTIARWRDIKHLGASPILRGLGDDKHLMKLSARNVGVGTPDSHIIRNGFKVRIPDLGPKMVVKPNASSASWGVKIVTSREEAREHAEWVLAQGHDCIFESYAEGIELAVPYVGGADGGFVALPVMKYTSDDDDRLRTYEEKRGLAPSSEGFIPCEEDEYSDAVRAEADKLMAEVWPFDYGRFEFKLDPDTGETNFIELNMSCNLWSRKTLSLSWQSLGYTHAELIETILCHSLMRQGLIDAPA